MQLIKVDGGGETELSFTPTSDGDDGKSDPRTVSTDVGNLVITDVSTNSGDSSYFLFDPTEGAGLQNPKVTFTFANEGDKNSSHNRYHWWLWIRSSDETNFLTYEGDLDKPGEKIVTIPYNDLEGHGKGTYAFELRVRDVKNDEVQDWFSHKISLSSHQFDFVNTPNADLEAQVSYQIDSTRDAQELTIQLFDSSLSEITSYTGGTQKNYLYDEIDLYTFDDNDLGGTYIAIFTAKDDFADTYRDHKNKDMFAVNKRNSTKPFHIWIAPEAYGQIGSHIYWDYIRACFLQVGIRVRFGINETNISNRSKVVPAGKNSKTAFQGWKVPYRKLSNDQAKSSPGLNRIVGNYTGGVSSNSIDDVIGLYFPLDQVAAIAYDRLNDLDDNPPDQSGLPSGYRLPPELTNQQIDILATNCLLHELTHALLGMKHCGNIGDTFSFQCVIYQTITKTMTTNMRRKNTVPYSYNNEYKTLESPWHALKEINEMRSKLDLQELNKPDPGY